MYKYIYTSSSCISIMLAPPPAVAREKLEERPTPCAPGSDQRRERSRVRLSGVKCRPRSFLESASSGECLAHSQHIRRTGWPERGRLERSATARLAASSLGKVTSASPLRWPLRLYKTSTESAWSWERIKRTNVSRHAGFVSCRFKI